MITPTLIPTSKITIQTNEISKADMALLECDILSAVMTYAFESAPKFKKNREENA